VTISQGLREDFVMLPAFFFFAHDCFGHSGSFVAPCGF
jgi:hypothetical protein